MKKHRDANWKLGIFAAAGLLVLTGAIYVVGKQKNIFGDVFRVSALFNSVGGLKVGNNVRFGGITVGTVDDIELVSDTSVRVEIVIQKNVQRYIKTDATASIGSDGLMGDKVLIIAPGTYTKAPVSDNGILSSRAPVETEQVMASLKASADNALIITTQLAQITYKINNGHGAVSRLLGDSSFANNFSKTMTNLKNSSEGLSENMEAAKHNFLLRGYFRKKKKQEEKKKKESEEKKDQR